MLFACGVHALLKFMAQRMTRTGSWGGHLAKAEELTPLTWQGIDSHRAPILVDLPEEDGRVRIARVLGTECQDCSVDLPGRATTKEVRWAGLVGHVSSIDTVPSPWVIGSPRPLALIALKPEYTRIRYSILSKARNIT